MNETMELTQSAFKELISDFIGAHLLGPAALACIGEFSVHLKLDVNPCACGRYPPWRMRIRKISEVVAKDLLTDELFNTNPECQALTLPYSSFLKQVQSLSAEDADKKEINADIRTREAYKLVERYWTAVQQNVLSLLPKESQVPYELKSRLSIVNELVQRLKQGIPPNETGVWPKTTPATIADIWNAAWAYSCLRLSGNPDWGTPNNFEDLFRLVLKAIEVSYVHTTFGPELKHIAEHEHTQQTPD